MAKQGKDGVLWCDFTFNCWIGCSKISPGCDNCYAERQDRHRKWTPGGWGDGKLRHRTSEDNWGNPVKWNKQLFIQCQVCGWRGTQKQLIHVPCTEPDIKGCPECQSAARFDKVRPRVFCASLSDVFDNDVDAGWLADLLELIWKTPNIDWLLLTKRIGNWKSRIEKAHLLAYSEAGEYQGEFFDWLDDWLNGKPPENVWLGATIVNQEEADRDIPKLLAVPAKVRFLSMEPLLGPVDLEYPKTLYPLGPPGCCSGHECGCRGMPTDPPLIWGINWVIGGGESGTLARLMEPDWVRSLRDQCKQFGVPFLFKQYGEWGPVDVMPSELAESLEIEDKYQFINGEHIVKQGKKKSGRILDGETHTEFPSC